MLRTRSGIDEPHFAHPFVGSGMLQGRLKAEDCRQGVCMSPCCVSLASMTGLGIAIAATAAQFVIWTDAKFRLIAAFGNGVSKDINAIRDAIEQPWSSGQAEGQVNKLKMVKRQMYGRRKIDRLRARLVGPS